MQPHIVFLNVDPEDESLIRSRFPQAHVVAGNNLPPQEVLKHCEGADIISTRIYTQFPEDIIEKLPNLKLLCTRTVGVDHIDREACAKQNVTVCNVPDYGSHVIAEHAFALLLSTIRRVPEATAKVKAGFYDYHGLRGIALKGKTIGIIGTGRIGRSVAHIAHGFGMNILGQDIVENAEVVKETGLKYTDLDTIFRESDIISLHAPATPETHYMISEKALSMVKKGVILINTARGDLIDEGWLLKALDNGTVRYALLDVVEHEKDLSLEHTLINHPNVVVTPHIAFYTEESAQKMVEDCLDSIDAFLAGKEPAHVVK